MFLISAVTTISVVQNMERMKCWNCYITALINVKFIMCEIYEMLAILESFYLIFHKTINMKMKIYNFK